MSKTRPAADKILADDRLSELFGLDMGTSDAKPDPANVETIVKTAGRRRAAKAPLKAAEAAPAAIYEEIPNVKLIVILRNPADRAFSHFTHNLRLLSEPDRRPGWRSTGCGPREPPRPRA